MFTLSENSKKNREGVDSRLIEISDLAIRISLVDFGHGRDAGLRTAARQNELFKQGVSKADGHTKLSNHQSGRALDFYAFVDGRASWQPEHLTSVAAAFFQAACILGHRIEWGGLWRPNGWDKPHIELID